MKFKAVQIQFGRNVLRANGGMELMAFKNMLLYLPSDSKIGGFLEGLYTDTVSILIENEKFDEVEQSHLIPVVTARFTNEYGYTQFDKFESNDCKQIKDGKFILEDKKEASDHLKTLQTPDVVRVKDLQDIPICFSAKIPRPGKYYYAFTRDKLVVNNDSDRLRGIKGFNEHKHYIEVNSKGRLTGFNPDEITFFPSGDNQIYSSFFPPPQFQESINKAMSDVLDIIRPVMKESTCSHSWKEYVGLIDKYNYCEKCDEKK